MPVAGKILACLPSSTSVFRANLCILLFTDFSPARGIVALSENKMEVNTRYSEKASEEIKTHMNIPSMSGPVLAGEGADKLSEEQLQYLLKRQMQLHEEEKLRQGM